jgi:hypothetical protein
MTVKESIGNGSEVVFDGNTWGLVTDTALENNEVQIMDEDGGEDWIDLNRVDAILDSDSPEGREHELRVVRYTINAPRSAEVMKNREAYVKACEEAIRTAKERVKKERKN